MSTLEFSQDLVILAPDKNTQYALEGLLTRARDLAIRPIRKTILACPFRDPAVFRQAHELLRPYLRSTRYALAVLDREGCGAEKRLPEEIESRIEENLAKNGWPGRSAAIVIDPELEVWVWTPSPYVPRVLGWDGDYAPWNIGLPKKSCFNLAAKNLPDPKKPWRRHYVRQKSPVPPLFIRNLPRKSSSKIVQIVPFAN